jgi:invasion protein IalB
MRQLVFASAAALMVSSFVSTPVFAQAAQAPTQAKQGFDPNEVVCQKEEDTGSRLSSHKVCMTRSQWAEQRRLNRQDIDKLQTQRPCSGEGGSC